MQISTINRRLLMPAIMTVALLLGVMASPAAANSATPEKAAAAAKANPMAEKWGIEITSVRLTANDHMVDFRYRVLDAKKADNLFARDAKPYLVDKKTGKVLAVPRTAKVGPLMSTYQHKQNRIYWMFFGNQGSLVKAGDEVSVVIGDFKAENLKVE